jgi:hypothetical protein
MSLYFISICDLFTDPADSPEISMKVRSLFFMISFSNHTPENNVLRLEAASCA